MITEEPRNWKDLQDKVNFILNGVGLKSEKEVSLNTPRGTVEIDVYAIDPKSVDKIKYIIECKNWNNKIPQTVVHSFTTVMYETGGNIGYIISKKGFQKGALEYSDNTNIKLFSYKQFQEHYLTNWYKEYFSLKIAKASDHLVFFTEPVNSRRFRYQEKLSESKKEQFSNLLDKYSSFAIMLLFIGSNSYNNIDSKRESHYIGLQKIKNEVYQSLNIKLNSENFQDLLSELEKIIELSLNEFIQVFGENIFMEKK